MRNDGLRHGETVPASGVVAGVVLLAAFALLSAAMLMGWTQGFDERALHWFATHRVPLLDYVMTRATSLGNGVVLLMIVLVSATFLALTYHRWFAYLLVAGVVGGIIANNLLKLAFARPRPEVVDLLDEVASKSFPSGHAMNSIIVYGTVAYIVSRLEATRTTRAITWIVAGAFILLIGGSRMYLGVHYPTDIIAGFLAGAAWVAFVASSSRAARRFGVGRGEQ
jgi:undecaprenyl-diphosphatase